MLPWQCRPRRSACTNLERNENSRLKKRELISPLNYTVLTSSSINTLLSSELNPLNSKSQDASTSPMYPGLYFLCFTFIHYISLPFPRNISEKTEPQLARIVSLNPLSIWPEELPTFAILHIWTNVKRKIWAQWDKAVVLGFAVRVQFFTVLFKILLYYSSRARCHSTEFSREHNQALREHHLQESNQTQRLSPWPSTLLYC